jgi:hypothetical protein
MKILTHALALSAFVFFSLAAQAQHSPAGVPPGTTLKTVSPIVINGKNNIVIRNVRISNPKGQCIQIQSANNVLIENSEIGPCLYQGINVSGSSVVKVRNVYIHDTGKPAVETHKSSGIEVYGSLMERSSKGVYATHSTKVVVAHNKFLNMNPKNQVYMGPSVQFHTIVGAGNRIHCNITDNVPGKSYPEDIINMYRSQGTSTDPIQIMGNKIRGGGPSTRGGGIVLGDSGGAYVLVKNNILVNSGSQGVGVAGGHHLQVINNLIYGRQQPWTGVGISVMDWNKLGCYSQTVKGNSVYWIYKTGFKNPGWNSGQCGAVTGWNQNTWNAPIGPSIWDLKISSCSM